MALDRAGVSGGPAGPIAEDDRDDDRDEAGEPLPCPACGCYPGERESWEGGDGVWFLSVPCGCDCHDSDIGWEE